MAQAETHTPPQGAPVPPPPQPAAKPAEPVKPEDLDKRLDRLEVLAGVRPPPPHKETVTAYYKHPPAKPEPEPKDEKPADKAAREARDKAAKEKADKPDKLELPPIVYEEAKNGRWTDGKFVVPADADAWSLDDPAEKKDGKDTGKADEPPKTPAPQPSAQSHAASHGARGK